MSNKLEVINQTQQELVRVIGEMDAIASKDNPTKADTLRNGQLLAQFKLLSRGVSPLELAQARMLQIKQETGNAEPAPISRDTFDEWRHFLENPKAEWRTDSQSTAQWGTSTGQTFDGTSGTQGGTLTPASFYSDRIFSMLADVDELIDPQNCTMWESEKGTGGSLPYISDISSSGSPVVYAFNKATVVDEAFQNTVVPFKTGKIGFGKVPTFRSGRILVSFEMAEDAPDLFAGTVGLLENLFAQRFALGLGSKAATNLLAALPSVQNVTTGSNASVQIADALALYAALPNIYRKNGVMIMSDSVRNQITTYFEANARTMVGGVEEVLRKRIVVSPNMPAFAAGQVAIVFADKRYLIQRRVKGDAGNFVRSYSQSAGAIEQGLTCVEGFMRADYQTLNTADAHFPPCATLTVHA